MLDSSIPKRERSMSLQRRQFLKSAVATGTGLVILPSGTLSGATAPSNKLNIALIGAWGRGKAHHDSLKSENVVALCDINEKHLGLAAKTFPKAKHYVDWRKCLDHKGLDAVVCATLDHTHAFVGSWALNRELHLYLEKPMGNTVQESRLLRAKYLKLKNKIATQCGTQRHQYPNFNRVRELIKDGAIGELKSAHAWGNRQIRRPGYLPAQGTPPKGLHYDLWLGPSAYHPYNPGYFSGGVGMNCLNWNMYWDFGTGQVGDMGSHTIDLAWNAIDGDLPTSAKAEGDPYHPEVTPVKLQAAFELPANNWRGPIRVTWYQGGAMPQIPSKFKYVDLNKIGHGAMFRGTQGTLTADFTSRILLPYGDLGYYTRRAQDKMIPDMGHFQKEWIDACKGDLKTSCDFDYSGTSIELMLLGLVAYRAGAKDEANKLLYDGAAGRVTNNAKANALLGKAYRAGWTLEG